MITNDQKAEMLDALLKAMDARGIVFGRWHGGAGGLEKVTMSREYLLHMITPSKGNEAPAGAAKEQA